MKGKSTRSGTVAPVVHSLELQLRLHLGWCWCLCRRTCWFSLWSLGFLWPLRQSPLHRCHPDSVLQQCTQKWLFVNTVFQLKSFVNSIKFEGHTWLFKDCFQWHLYSHQILSTHVFKEASVGGKRWGRGKLLYMIFLMPEFHLSQSK